MRLSVAMTRYINLRHVWNPTGKVVVLRPGGIRLNKPTVFHVSQVSASSLQVDTAVAAPMLNSSPLADRRLIPSNIRWSTIECHVL